MSFVESAPNPEVVGLDYFGARYFSAAQGRFTSPDPANAGVSLTDPESWNAYAYVRNSPLRFVDPHGLSPTCILDGLETDCGLARGLASSGAATGCPGNVCEGWGSNGRGQIAYLRYSADAAGNGSYNPITTAEPDPALPANQIYRAFLLAARFGSNAIDPNAPVAVTVRYVGSTYNVQIPNDLTNIDLTSSEGFKDPLRFVHNGLDSYYMGAANLATVDPGHVVADPGGIEAHYDSFGPYNPLHEAFEWLPALVFNTRAQADAPTSSTRTQWLCSINGGCHQ